MNNNSNQQGFPENLSRGAMEGKRAPLNNLIQFRYKAQIQKIDNKENVRVLSGKKMHFFVVPSLTARTVLEVSGEVVVCAAYQRLFIDDLIIFRKDEAYWFGRICFQEVWRVKECQTGEIFSIGTVEVPRKVIGYAAKNTSKRNAGENAAGVVLPFKNQALEVVQ